VRTRRRKSRKYCSLLPSFKESASSVLRMKMISSRICIEINVSSPTLLKNDLVLNKIRHNMVRDRNVCIYNNDPKEEEDPQTEPDQMEAP
jgi:hypothetical protein